VFFEYRQVQYHAKDCSAKPLLLKTKQKLVVVKQHDVLMLVWMQDCMKGEKE